MSREESIKWQQELRAMQQQEEYIKQLSRAVGLIAWGYIFLHFDINLGTLNIVPKWVGYILMLAALPKLEDEESTTMLLMPIGIALAVIEGIRWICTLFFTFYLEVVLIIAAALQLYFHFQLLTNLSDIAERYDCHPQQERILKLRTVMMVIMTMLALPFWNQNYGIVSTIVTLGLAVIYLIVLIWLLIVLFSFKKELEQITILPNS